MDPCVDKAWPRPIFARMDTSSMTIDIAGILLDANGPRDAASRTLAWLLEQTRARTVALWRVEDDALELELSRDADAATIHGSERLWAQRTAEAIVERRAFRDDNSVLMPTRGIPDSYIYADGVDSQGDLGILGDGAAIAVKALRRGPQFGNPSGFKSLRRDELIATLRLHEWNIARVARIRGVTRKTIYDWLQKYDIKREHVEK
jgi:Bacterial regulatory protein, Fis family